MPTQKIDPKVIFASDAPAIDRPPVFSDKTKGWDVARSNDGRPTIKEMNKVQQDTDLKILWLNENSVTPYDASIDYPEGAVAIKDGSFKQLVSGAWVEFLDDFANKDEVKRGIANRYDSSLTYNSGERVVLTNGDIVKSTIDGNTNDPNVNMTGWIKTNSASQIFDESGESQQEINDSRVKTVETTLDLFMLTDKKNGDIYLTQDTLTFYEYIDDNLVVKDKRVILSEDYPRFNGETDDTGRMNRMALAIQRFDKTPSLSGYPSVPQTEVILASGEYILSDTIQFPPFVTVKSDGKATVYMQDLTKNIFSFINTYTNVVYGIVFQGGKHHVYFENGNSDATVIFLDMCEHHSSSDYAIMTHGTTSAEDTHLSALLVVSRAKFLKCKKALYNVCDKAILDRSWLYPHYENFTENTAWIMNHSGHLHLTDNLGVPVMGGANWGGVPRKNGARWIDNYGSLLCDGTRFGMEADGMVIVHSYGGLESSDNMGSSIILKNCQTSAGISWVEGGNNIGVVKIMDKFPRQIVIEDNNYQLGCPALIVNDKANTLSYLQSFNTNNRIDRKLSIIINRNMAWGENEMFQDYPAWLGQWVNRGTVDPTLSPVKHLSISNSGKITDFTYPVPYTSSSLTYLVCVSGNPNSSGSFMYRLSKTFLLNMGTGYSGTKVVNYLSMAEIDQGALPVGVDATGNISIDVKFVATGNKVSDAAYWVDRDFILTVSGVDNTTVNITPLNIGLFQFGTTQT